MKTIRSFSKNPLTIVVLLLSFLNLSCNQDDFVESYVDNSVSDKYSGEEIFKGIFFLQGNFAEEVNSLKQSKRVISSLQLNNDEIKKMEKFYGHIIKEINEKYPQYFDEFKKSLRDKDFYNVNLALNEATDLIREIGLESQAYGYLFNISDQMIEKNVDFNREDIKRLDLTNSDDTKEFFRILKDDYNIGIDPDLGEDATCNLGVWCAVTMVAAVQSVAGAWVYVLVTKVKVWDPTSNAKVQNEVLVSELNTYFNNIQ